MFVTYANALSKEYDVTFLVISDKGFLRTEICDSISVIELRASRLRYAIPDLVWMFMRHGFDYVVTGMLETTFPAVIANILTFNRVKIIASKHDYKMHHKKFLLWAINHSWKFFAVSERVLEKLKRGGSLKVDARVIYNPILKDAIREGARADVAGMPEKYIVFVGRFSNIKNIPFLLKGFALFVRRHPDYSLLLVGDGRIRKRLQHIVAKLGIEKSVVFVGAVQNPYPYIAKSQMLALTSFSEGLPTVVLEALALGKTVVSTPNGGGEEILENGKYGYLTSSFTDAKALSERFEYALSHPVDGAEAMRRADEFDLQTAMAKFKAML